MVARDGIEPPTPAFSGPRSTTELPGLSADFMSCNVLRGLQRGRMRWAYPRTVRCNNLDDYSNFRGAKPNRRPHPTAGLNEPRATVPRGPGRSRGGYCGV